MILWKEFHWHQRPVLQLVLYFPNTSKFIIRIFYPTDSPFHTLYSSRAWNQLLAHTFDSSLLLLTFPHPKADLSSLFFSFFSCYGYTKKKNVMSWEEARKEGFQHERLFSCHSPNDTIISDTCTSQSRRHS